MDLQSLIQQGKFLLILEVFMGAVVVACLASKWD